MSWLRGRFLSESEAIGLSAPDAGQRQYGAFAHGDPVELLMCDFEGQPEGFEHFHCLGFVVGFRFKERRSDSPLLYDIAVRIPPSAEQNSGAALYAVLRDIPESRLTAYSGTDAEEGAEGVAFDSLADWQLAAVMTLDSAAAKPTLMECVKRLLGGGKAARSDIVIGNTPAALTNVGCRAGRLVISEGVVDKSLFDHHVPQSVFASLQALIADPAMIFESETQAGTFVVVTTEAIGGRPVMVFVRPMADAGRVEVSRVVSMYGKDKPEVILRWMKNGLLYYADKQKSLAVSTLARLQLPGRVQLRRGGQMIFGPQPGSNSTDSTTCATWAVLHEAAHDSAFGERSAKPPTPAQCEAGNYKVGRAKVQGFHVAIENPAGSIRRGTDPNGVAWETRMPAHYGYLSGTTGADGDGIDCFIGPWPELPDIYVVNQWLNGRFDEHKVMFGCIDEAHARSIYLASYSPGWQGLRDIVRATPKQLRAWLRTGNPNKPLTSGDLPTESTSMEKVMWDGLQPIGKGMAEVLYGLRAEDADEGLLFDSLTEDDLAAEFTPGDVDAETFDAIAIESRRIEATAKALQRALNAQAGIVKPVDFTVSKPRMFQGVVNVTLMYRLSDGQTLTIFFNNPDATPRRLKPEDVLVSWKWLLNRKDVTIVVAPERGRDLNLSTVALRVMALADKNSAAFTTAQAGAAAKEAVITDLKAQIKAKTEEFEGLERQIAAIKSGEVVPAEFDKDKAVADRVASIAAWDAGDADKAWEIYRNDPTGHVKDRAEWEALMEIDRGPTKAEVAEVTAADAELKAQDEARAAQSDEMGADYPLSATYANTGGGTRLTVRLKDKNVRFHIAATDQAIGDYFMTTIAEMSPGSGLTILDTIAADGETMTKVRQQIADFGAQTPAKIEPSVEFLIDAMTPFIGRSQMSAVRSGLKGEEGGYFRSTLADLLAVIDGMPKTGETDGQGDEAVARLHYFRGGSDWYITEKDVGSEDDEAARYEKARKAGALITTVKRRPRQTQAFGYAILNGDRQNAELGYINIEELTENGVELDFHFTPKSLRAIKGNDGGERVAPPAIDPDAPGIWKRDELIDALREAALKMDCTLPEWTIGNGLEASGTLTYSGTPIPVSASPHGFLNIGEAQVQLTDKDRQVMVNRIQQAIGEQFKMINEATPSNAARDAAKQFLMDAKAGVLDFSDTAMTEKLEAAYTPFADDPEIAELFNDAVNAFVDFETARAATIA